MAQEYQWCEESDQVLKYLYQDLKIFNWDLISQQLSSRFTANIDPTACRKRFLQTSGPVVRDEWTPEEEKQLYRLHNQYGNKWAVIAQNLLGRNDNCVKNHFYSKLRKSLRTLNKIGKLYLKKQVKQVSDVVLYKLTEATDQSLKANSQISKQLIAQCYQLKNRLLEYDVDQKNIQLATDYSNQKQIIQGLTEFNKYYKKKSKKEKTTYLGTENLKKPSTKKKKSERGPKLEQLYCESQEQQQPSSDSIKIIHQKKTITKIEARISENNNFVYRDGRSQSEYSIPKKTINFLIKAPSQQDVSNYEKQIDGLSERKSVADAVVPTVPIHLSIIPHVNQGKGSNPIEDILKAEGILENAQYGSGNHNYFRRSSSARSFSICSDSSNPDMLEDLKFGGVFKELSEIQNDSQSQIFNNQQD